MVQIARPDFYFRARRNYIHSTNIYDFLLAGAEESGLGQVDGAINIVIRKSLRNHLEIHYLEAGDPREKPQNAVIDFSVFINGEEITGWFLETDNPVDKRIPYDETPIRELSSIDDQTITIKGNSNRTPIEVVTSLAVKLHPHLYPPPEGQKWLATKLILHRPLRSGDSTHLWLKMVKKIGDRLTKSEISIPGEEIGHIFFSLGTP